MLEKTLVIAEKPSAGMDIARVLNCTQKKDGYLESDDYIVTWAIGHLIGLKYPEEHDIRLKEWKLEDLPLLFEISNSLKVLPNTAKQFNIIKALIHRNDVTSIVNAGDAGREGYLIQEWIYRMAGNKKPTKVLWASSLTDEALKKAFAQLKDPKEFVGILEEAEARAEGDYLLGINYSRALTLTKSEGIALRYGRCQTPVLNLIVKRDKEIEDFVPEPYCNIVAEFQFGNSKFTGYFVDENEKKKAFSKEEVEQILEDIRGYQGIVKEYKVEEKSQKAPLLFDLTTLQKTMNNKYGYSAKETLEIAQSLYETHKILSYPRTDSRHLSDDIYNEIEQHIESCCFGEYEPYVKKLKISKDKRYFNNLKISDHHALIPTINSNTKEIYKMLNEREKNVFDSIVRSFLAIFLQDYEFTKTTILLEVRPYLFKASGITVKDLGYKEIYNKIEEHEVEDEKEQALPILEKDDTLDVIRLERKDYMTKPPARYTVSTILATMEKLNIGTPATRAEILEKLQNPNSQYIEENKKHFTATSLGKQLIEVVPEKLKDPELTANFELKLKEIAEGRLKKSEFLHQIIGEIQSNIEEFKNDGNEKKIKRERETFGKCPYCKQGDIVEYQKSYACTNYQSGCKFTIWKEIASRKITKTIVKQLMKNGITNKLEFLSKNGKKFNGKLKLTKEGVEFSFK